MKALKFSIIFQTSGWYPFRCGDKQCIVSLACLTTILESRKTFKFLTLSSMAFLRPWTRASYSTVLFVHSNSSLQERNCLFFSRSIRTQPSPNPSCVLEPSKYENKNLSSKSTWLVLLPMLETKFTILQSISSFHETWRSSYCVSDSELASST